MRHSRNLSHHAVAAAQRPREPRAERALRVAAIGGLAAAAGSPYYQPGAGARGAEGTHVPCPNEPVPHRKCHARGRPAGGKGGLDREGCAATHAHGAARCCARWRQAARSDRRRSSSPARPQETTSSSPSQRPPRAFHRPGGAAILVPPPPPPSYLVAVVAALDLAGHRARIGAVRPLLLPLLNLRRGRRKRLLTCLGAKAREEGPRAAFCSHLSRARGMGRGGGASDAPTRRGTCSEPTTSAWRTAARPRCSHTCTGATSCSTWRAHAVASGRNEWRCKGRWTRVRGGGASNVAEYPAATSRGDERPASPRLRAGVLSAQRPKRTCSSASPG